MSQEIASEVPLLLLIFNRPETTRQVVAALSAVKPRYLYIAADGPRPNRPDDFEKSEAARKIATTIDWPCEIKTLFRVENMGCRLAVSTAIDWFFENVEEGIILEDDCVPDPSFFPYAKELLARYRDDERVMEIATKHHGAGHTNPYSYYFSRYPHCWGWASWRRAWKLYDRDMAMWPELRNTDWLLSVGNGSRLFQKYWTNIFDMAYEGKKVDSWAYRWFFSCWAQNGLAILPTRNLVINIGFGMDATHTLDGGHMESRQALESMCFPLVHPPCMVRDVAADAYSDHYFFRINWTSGIKNILRKIPMARSFAKMLRSL